MKSLIFIHNKIDKVMRLINTTRLTINIILTLPALLLFSACEQSEENKVKSTCDNFIKGRIALKKGDDTQLKAVTEDSLFKLIKLNQEYMKLLTATVIEADLNIYAKSAVVNGDSASCVMSGFEPYEITLRKYNGIWKVKAENGMTATPEKIAAIKKKIADEKIAMKIRPAQHKVLRFVNSFLADTKNYFKGQPADSLSIKSTPATLDFIKRFYIYAKKRTGVPLLTKEMDAPNFLSADVAFEGNKAFYLFYNENISISLEKHGDSYLITGFNGTDSKYLKQQNIEDNYINLLRALKLMRSEQYRDKEIK